MSTASMSGFLRRLTRGMVAEALRERTDRQLLEQLLAGSDEAVFEALVRRHGPMVYRVCWGVLHQEQDAEDAFQATFLVLAQQLHRVRRQSSLASWLHGVARRVALKARARAATSRRHEHKAAAEKRAADEIPWSELRDALDAELARLPEKWRTPLVLCYLEGLTQDEAATQLGWSQRTLRRRLKEAKAALGRSLARRGLPWPAALPVVLLSECMSPAALTPRLIRSTVETAATVVTGQAVLTTACSGNVAALMEGVLNTMFLSKIKIAMAALTLLATLALGTGGLHHRSRAVEPQKPPKAEKPLPRQEDGPKAQPKKHLDRALQLIKDSDADPYEKVCLLAEVAGVKARRGERKDADAAFQLALSLVKDIKKDIFKVGALGFIARNQLAADDVKAGRKTLAAMEKLRDDTDDDSVRLNATNGVEGIRTSIAAAQARRGEMTDALKTADEISNGHLKTVAYGSIAREQARRKDFAGALKTIKQTDSIRIPRMLFDVARIQEKMDKTGAEATWKLCAKELQKLELSREDEIVPERGGLDFREMLPALVARGHGAAVQRWIDGLPSVAVKVRLLLILAGNDRD